MPWALRDRKSNKIALTSGLGGADAWVVRFSSGFSRILKDGS